MTIANFSYSCEAGTIYARISKSGIQELILAQQGSTAPHIEPLANLKLTNRLLRALDRYFSGKRESFERFPLDLNGYTSFRRSVWASARQVKWGETSSYGGLCGLMGRTAGTARAVGQALGANPIPIIIPCHRILAGDGSLGGFSCGLDWKIRLLRLEGHDLTE